MRADSHTATDTKSLGRVGGSVRARMFVALLFTALPGIVFGALVARSNYRIASHQEALVRNDDAERAAVRLDDLVAAAAQQAGLVATRPEVRNSAPSCSNSLAAAAAASGYAALARTDASGRLECASQLVQSYNAGGTEWFDALRGGARSAVSGLTRIEQAGETAIIVGAPIRRGAAFAGASFVVIPKSKVQQVIAAELGGDVGAIVAFDRRGSLLTTVARDVDTAAAANAAGLALGSSRGTSVSDGLSAERVAAPDDAFMIVSVAPAQRQTDIGLRAALIVLAPILVAALSFGFVWLALDWWVLRWFYQLRTRAASFALGQYAPAAMRGAPSEIGDLAAAFDNAVSQAQARERELSAALDANINLTRELHHRVKNNLQVLSSLVSRQQRRSSEPIVRAALSEARARMAPVALIYRFINPPEDRLQIDLAAYLRELARQLHVALNGEARAVTLDVYADTSFSTADDATNLGLIVAEAMTAGYANAAPDASSTATLHWRKEPDGGYELAVGVRNGAPASHPLDKELIEEIARQLDTTVTVDALSMVSMRLKITRLGPAPSITEV